jgi:PAS domain S-box-containing protein
VNSENKTKEQLISELAELQQIIIDLKLAQQNQNLSSIVPEPSSSSSQFSTGRYESLVSFNHGYQQSINNSNKYHISELIDIPLLQQLFDSFFELTGIMHAVLDADTNILSRTGWSDMCLNFHRVCPQTECRCKQSDSYISGHLQDGQYIRYRCLNGLIDYATPIVVEGQHLATIYMGQLLNEPPIEEYFRQQAQEFGFDEAAYIEALHKIHIVPENRIKPIMEFYSKLGQILASMGLERLRRIEEADHTIREREERLRLVLDASNDGFWDWKTETDEIYRSPRWAEIIGCSRDEIESNFHEWEKRVHPDDIHATMKALNEHINGQTPRYESEYRLLTMSGDWKWILDRGKVVARNEQGKPLRMVGTCIDITERKQADAALLQSEEKFSKAFHCNPDPMSITTLQDGCYVEVNDAYLKATGYKQHEIIGRTVLELNIWDIPEQRKYMLKQIHERGSIRGFESGLRIKSGEIRTFIISGEIINLNGEQHLICSIRDISEHKRMEEALRLSEECFSKAFDASPVLMSISTLEDGRFIKANNALCRTLGFNDEEIIGQLSLELGFWSDPVDRHLVKQRLMANQSVQDMDIRFCKNTGEQRLGLFSAEKLDVHGEPCMLSILMDITELRQMEIEMTRLDRLNLVGEMAASIGHEIRNPMTTVRGYLQILRENKDYVQEIGSFDLMIEELDSANSIITEFLSLAKNKMLDMKPRSLNAIIIKTLPLMQTKAMSQDKNIKLELEELPDLLLDSKEIRQLILNLVNNGLESMSSPGFVTIRTFVEKDKVVLAVQDQGHGIDHELLDKLGTPFLTTKEQGTGLGLAVCYRIATRHNAKIDIDTSSNGTTFYVRFQN